MNEWLNTHIDTFIEATLNTHTLIDIDYWIIADIEYLLINYWLILIFHWYFIDTLIDIALTLLLIFLFIDIIDIDLLSLILILH